MIRIKRLIVTSLDSLEIVSLEVMMHGCLVGHAVAAEVLQVAFLADEKVALQVSIDLVGLHSTEAALLLLTVLVVVVFEPISIGRLASEVGTFAFSIFFHLLLTVFVFELLHSRVVQLDSDHLSIDT